MSDLHVLFHIYEVHGQVIYPSFFFFRKAKDHCGRDVWLTNDTYWKLRENPGFANTENITLWWRDGGDERHQTKTRICGQHTWTALSNVQGGDSAADLSVHPWLAHGNPTTAPSTGLLRIYFVIHLFIHLFLDYVNKRVSVHIFWVFCRKDWTCDARSADCEMKNSFTVVQTAAC